MKKYLLSRTVIIYHTKRKKDFFFSYKLLFLIVNLKLRLHIHRELK